MKTPPGLIITYNPSLEFFTRLDLFYTQLEQIIVVDNGSNPDTCRLLDQETQRRGSSLNVIFNETNLGIAKALNQGCSWALEHGYEHIIAFDQDSHPAPGMIFIMLEAFSTYAEDGKLAVVAPVVLDPLVKIQARYLRPKNKWLFERVFCDCTVLEDVTFVITAGSLYDLKTYQQIGPFRDDFFIDYVDIEYCLRARRRGYQIIVTCDAHLNHRQGERERRVFWGQNHYPTFHSPLRWYFSARNRIQMFRQYAICFPNWAVYEVIAGFYIFIKMLLFETQKIAKLRAFYRGTLDGIRGRIGRAPDFFE